MRLYTLNQLSAHIIHVPLRNNSISQKRQSFQLRSAQKKLPAAVHYSRIKNSKSLVELMAMYNVRRAWAEKTLPVEAFAIITTFTRHDVGRWQPATVLFPFFARPGHPPGSFWVPVRRETRPAKRAQNHGLNKTENSNNAAHKVVVKMYVIMQNVHYRYVVGRPTQVKHEMRQGKWQPRCQCHTHVENWVPPCGVESVWYERVSLMGWEQNGWRWWCFKKGNWCDWLWRS